MLLQGPLNFQDSFIPNNPFGNIDGESRRLLSKSTISEDGDLSLFPPSRMENDVAS